MHYLHSSHINSHGFLSAQSCLQVDNRFMVKITDYGIRQFTPPVDLLPAEKSDEDRDFKVLLWRASELLRQLMPARGTQVIHIIQILCFYERLQVHETIRFLIISDEISNSFLVFFFQKGNPLWNWISVKNVPGF